MIDDPATSLPPDPINRMNRVVLEPEIQISTLMRVDARNVGDVIMTFSFAVVVIIVIVILVYAGVPEKVNEDKLFSVSRDRFFQFSASITGLSSLNMYTSVFLNFRRLSSTTPSLLNVSVHTAVHTFSTKTHSLVLVFESDTQHNVSFAESSDESYPIHIFYDRLVYRTAYRLSASIRSDQLEVLNSLEVIWKSGDPAIAWISIVLKLCYALVAFSVSLSYLRLMRICPFSGWASEQKLTIFATVLCLLNDFPLAGLYTSRHSRSILLLFSVVISAFQGFLVFYVLMLFDSVSCRHRRRTAIFIVFGIFSTILAIVESFFRAVAVTNAFRTNLLDRGKLRQTHLWVCRAVADVAVVFGMLRAFFVKDETERFRFVIYLMQTGLMFAVRWVAQYVDERRSELTSILSITGENVFVVLSAYLHWPYKYAKDAVYEDAKMQDRQMQQDVVERILQDEQAAMSDVDETVL